MRFKSNRLELVETKTPEVSEREALIKVILAGICATDLEITQGYIAFEGTLGHEFVGVVEECADMPELVGRRVVGEINAGCGWCDWCRRGLARHCPQRTVLGISGLDGAFADYLVLPAWNLHPVPDEVDDRRAVFAEPLAAAMEILEQVHIPPGAPVLLVGDGRLAQLIVRVLARAGCLVEAVGRSERKIRRMRGYAHKGYLNAPPPDVKYPFVVEASGSPRGWRSAVNAVEPRGTVILKSTYAGRTEFNPAPLVVDEITVVGSRCGRFAPALKALAGGLEVSDLIDAEFPLTQWKEAMNRAREPETLKVLLEIAEPTG